MTKSRAGEHGVCRTAQYFCDHAWLGGTSTEVDVLISTAGDRIAAVETGAVRPRGAVRLRGLTIPGFANVHSHAFHRALRGRTQAGRGSFWTWREEMYRTAEVLTPENYHRLARAAYAEMVLAGTTAVGEFHYLHHGPGGSPYADANAMGRALVAAAAEAGLRITLIDTCYLESAPGCPPEGAQARFADASAQAWAERVGEMAGGAPAPGARLGAAVHSVRAVPPQSAEVVARYSRDRGLPLHFHLSEQDRENELSHSAYGLSPTELLGTAGALGPGSTAVHATHLSDGDVLLLAGSGTGVCICPTTEQDLGDGIGPARRLATAGSSVSLGSDSHAVIDPFLEMRSLEYDERLASATRGHWAAHELLAAATTSGHRAIGWPEAGSITVGAMADMVTIDLSSPRLARADDGYLVELAALSACAADVTHVVSSGKVVVAEGRHVLVDDVGGALRAAIAAVVTP
jgi:formiminoglutamate deiminase